MTRSPALKRVTPDPTARQVPQGSWEAFREISIESLTACKQALYRDRQLYREDAFDVFEIGMAQSRGCDLHQHVVLSELIDGRRGYCLDLVRLVEFNDLARLHAARHASHESRHRDSSLEICSGSSGYVSFLWN